MSPSGRIARTSVWLAGGIPFFVLVAGAWLDRLGPEPVDTLTHTTGEWALRLLVLTLAVSPLRHLTGATWLLVHRRTLGLLAYFYACLHFATYLVFGLELDFGELASDVRDRPYITIGFATLVLLTPLALTSTRRAIRRLGGRRWRSLHRLVYLAAVGASIHFYWSVKADVLEPLIYAAIIAILLLLRLLRLHPKTGRKRLGYASLPRSSRSDAARQAASRRSDEAV